MSGFEPRWLELREPADARARAEGAIDTLLRARAGVGPLGILDLGAGTGANLRYLAPRLGGRQQWLLLDRDRRLLDAIPAAMEAWSVRMGYGLRRRADSMAVEGPGFHCRFRLLELDMAARPAELPIPGHQLITASALQTALIEGLAAATAAMAPASEARLTAWCKRRLELLKLGRSRVSVGHQDLLGHLG
jgi:hypothetical protein